MRATIRQTLLVCCAVLWARDALGAISVTPNPNTGSYTVAWDAVNAYPFTVDQYQLKESTNGTTWTTVYQGLALSTALSGRAIGTYAYRLTYCYTLYIFGQPYPVCTTAESSPGVPWEATATVTSPSVPTGLTAPSSDSDGAYTVSWSTSALATSYELQEQSNGGAFTTVQNTAATSKALSGKSDATYGYRVRGCDGSNCSAWTATKSVQVLNTPGVPGPITGPSTDPDGAYSINWTAATGTVTSYKLEERITGGTFAQIQNSSALSKAFTGKINNTYEYRARACNALSCGGYTAIKSVQVTGNPGNPDTPNAPPAPQIATIPPPSASSDAVGVVPGSFRVDESGAATYSIPIATVPGSGGVAPVVSLDYSSQGGNGVVGVGWRLSGLSVITRCRQSKETDNGINRAVKFDSNDRFCLDGQRLVLVSGTYGSNGAEYRTEIDSFARVISYGTQGSGPSYFKVWRKDGSVSEYGNTTSSKIEAFGANSSVYAWAQNKFSDSAGNYIDTQYVEDATNGIEFVVDKILYTGNSSASTAPFAELRFVYDTNRLDKSRGYFAGAATKQTKRLIEIQSWTEPYPSGASTQVRRYVLDYESAPTSNVSRLTSVTLCGPSVCLEPTTFTWQDAGGGFAATATTSQYTKNFSGAKPADIDGDGDADLVWLRTNNSGNKNLEIFRSEDGAYVSQGFVANADSADAKSWQVMDYDNDGQHDLLYPENGYWRVRFGQVGAGGNPGFGAAQSTGVSTDGYNKLAVADFDGNGLADFIYSVSGQLYVRFLTKTDTTYAFGPAQMITHNFCAPGDCGASFTLTAIRPIVADFNGDGTVDLVLKVKKNGTTSLWRAYTASQSGGTIALAYYADLNLKTDTENPKLSLGDWNGDGLLDVAYAAGSSATSWYYRTNTGTQLNSPILITTLSSDNEMGDWADYNGDGRQDFWYTVNSVWWVRLAGETGLASSGINTGLPSAGGVDQQNYPNYFHDINGDGRPDLTRFYIGDDTSKTYVHVRLGLDPFVPANVVTAITNGFGAATEIQYQAFTDPAQDAGYYAKSSNGREETWGNGTPVIDLLAPIYAVKRVQSSAPAAGSYPEQVDVNAMSAVSYRYAGGKIQGGGRGSLGYASLTTIDEQRGIETTTSYLQNFPFIGYPASTEVKTGTGEAVSSAQNTWLDKTAGAGTFRQPYLSQAIEYTCDLASAGTDCDQGSGALLTTVTTTTTVDGYGNALTVNVTTTGDGVTVGKATTNTYTDDVPNWKLGRLTATTVIHSRTGEPNVTRTASFGYATGSKILNQETTEPNGSPSETLTTTYTLDAFGNRRVATVTGWDGSATVNRVTTLTFDSKGRFANESRNAYNQLTELVVTRNTIGQPTQVKNISQVPTDIRYGDLGQEYFRRDPTGAFVHVEQALCTDVGGCPEAAYYRSRKTVAGGGRSDVYFDVLGREVRTASVGFNGTEVYVDTEYDHVGRVARKSEPYFANETSYWTEFSYDVLGRVEVVRHPDYPSTGNQTTSDFDGFVTTITNGQGQHKIETRNAVGELTLVEDALGNTVTYTYDATGNLKTSLQAEAGTGATALSTLSHDKLGRKTAMTDADMGSWSYAYNAFGELIQQTTAIAGKYTTVAYDLLGRMTNRIDFAGGTQEANAGWLYDACTNGLGQLCGDDTTPGQPGPNLPPSLVRVFAYDSYGRPQTTTTTIGSDIYVSSTTYDQFGRVFQRFDGAETYSGLEYQYTPDGHLEAAIESRGSASVTVERYRITAKDARGQVTGLSKGGIDVSRTYAADSGRLESIYAQTQLAVTIQDFAFEWDVLGNLTDKVDSHRGLNESYTYDALNRLTSVGGSSSLTLTYDGLGNIDSKSDVGSYTYGASRPHAVTSDGTRTFSYDGNGNLTAGSDGRSNSYTVFNKPYAMSRAGSTVTIDYGPNRERYRRLDNVSGQVTVTHYVGTIEKITRPGPVIEIKRYLDGEAIETITGSTRTTEYLFTDHLGSVDVITNASGTVVQSMAFDAFGRRRDAVDYDAFTDPMLFAFDTTKTTRGFTFHEQLDPVGLIHMNGRVYDPTLGRFLSPDPFVQDPSNTQSLNRYSYVFNNPLSYTDPSGYFVDLGGIGRFIFDTIVNSIFRNLAERAWLPNANSLPGTTSTVWGNGAPPPAGTASQRTCLFQSVCRAGGLRFGPDNSSSGFRIIVLSEGGTDSDETNGNFENGAATNTFEVQVFPKRVRTRVPGTDTFLQVIKDSRGKPVTIVRGDLPTLHTWFDIESIASWVVKTVPGQILLSVGWELANDLGVDQAIDHPRFFSVQVGWQRVYELQLYEKFEDVFDAVYDPNDTGRVISGINRRSESTNLVVTKEIGRYEKLVMKVCWKGQCVDTFEALDAR